MQEQGYTGNCNLLYRYITQGRAEGDRPVTTPRWLARLLLTHPDHLRDKDASLLVERTAACFETTQMAVLIREYAQLRAPATGNDKQLTAWIVRSARRSCPISTTS